MPRDIDDKKKRKALRKLRKAAERAEANGTELSDWEREFIDEVEERVETFGSAFNDREKGALDEPLSVRQQMKLKEIDKKSRGKGGFKAKRSGFKSKSRPVSSPRSRDINDDVVDAPVEQPAPETREEIAKLIRADRADLQTASHLLPKSVNSAKQASKRRSGFRVIDGGKTDEGKDQ